MDIVPNKLFVAECVAAQRALIEPVRSDSGFGNCYRWTDINADLYIGHMIVRLMEAHPENRPDILAIEKEMKSIAAYCAPELACQKMVACFSALSPHSAVTWPLPSA